MIRRFASQRLDDADETLSRLEGYLLGILDQAAPRHGSQDRARRRLDSEQPNLQVVLRWAIDRRRPSGQLLRASETSGYGCSSAHPQRLW